MNQNLGKAVNVNCELHDYKPISFEHIKELMKDKLNNWDLIRKEEDFEEEFDNKGMRIYYKGELALDMGAHGIYLNTEKYDKE
jgi:hypothetical protein